MKASFSGLLLATFMSAALFAANALAAQDDGPEARPIYKRDQWLPDRVPTSDDGMRVPVPADYNAFLYAYEGDVNVGEVGMPLPHRAAGVLSGGDAVRLEAGPAGARVLLLAGKPIGEPVVQYGPFVMNTREEIEQAIADFQAGELGRAAVQRIKVA